MTEKHLHDRGPFGQLLAELRELSVVQISFYCDLEAGAEDMKRWEARASRYGDYYTGTGRTGEEALRSLVDRVKKA